MQPTRSLRLACAALALVALCTFLSPAPSPAGAADGTVPAAHRSLAEALVAALSTGDPATFEAFAQAHFAPVALQRRTPANRRQFLEQLHGELGRLTLVEVIASGPSALRVKVRSANGQLTGVLALDLEPAPPHRILAMGVDVGQGGGDEPPAKPLPPLPSLAGATNAAALAAALDPYLEKLAGADELSGNVLVALDGHALYSRSFGMADRERAVANTPATRHNIASIGKKLTQTAIAQLLAQGKLRLDSTLGELLPDYPNRDAHPATVEQLVEHRAGIRDMFSLPPAPQAPRSNRDWFAVVAPAPLDFPPGTQNRYCNGCYVVLGEIVARLSGTTYEEYLARHVFAPAGMGATAFLGFGEGAPDQAMLYTRGPEGLRPPGFRTGMRGSGAGGVYSTGADLLAFDNALRGYRLADRKRTAWLLGSEEEASPGRAAGGLGIAGGSPGTSAVLDSDGRWTVIVLTNRDPRLGEDLGIALSRGLPR
jgi:D-alanyl-D-alanine carboxypeptidase